MKLFRERYNYEIPDLLKFLGVTRICETSIEFKHGYVSFGKNWPELQMDHSYEEGIPRLCFCLVWMAFHIEMPFIKQRYDDVNNSPRYGFTVHDKAIWWHWGLKTFPFHFPWSWEIYRSDALGKDGVWVKNNWDSDDIYKESHPYTYKLRSGEIQNRVATISQEYREWRWRWFMLIPFPRIVRNSINIDFDGEVGEEAGSWKGGTTGCGYDIKKGETMLECLRRMEAERKFSR